MCTRVRLLDYKTPTSQNIQNKQGHPVRPQTHLAILSPEPRPPHASTLHPSLPSYTTPQPLPTMSKPADLPSKTSSSSFWHTEPKLLNHRTTASLPQKVDIVVIGSGISGASVVHHVFENSESEEGEEVEKPSVLVLEAREVCWGATGR
jgi:hypothetical protein